MAILREDEIDKNVSIENIENEKTIPITVSKPEAFVSCNLICSWTAANIVKRLSVSLRSVIWHAFLDPIIH